LRGEAAVIDKILIVTLTGFALGAVFMAFGNRRVPPQAARARWYKLGVFFLIIHAMLAAVALGRAWVVAAVLLIVGAGSVELARAWQRIARPRPSAIWPVFALAAVAALWSAAVLPPPAFAFLFLAAAACDGFSQVTGQWLGRHPLAPRISPAKTIEGLLGGLCAAAFVAAMVSPLIGLGPARAAGFGLLIGVAGLAGDLAASWVKRRAGIKDYSAALPGQGGFLDRFDSLLGALALVAWLM
jgi:phosphatidate cytidylyltransferase